MNDTQWIFEYESLRYEEEERINELKLIAQHTKKAVINLLGLNLLPIEGEDGLLRRPEDHEVVPLAALTGNEAVIKEIGERNEEYYAQEEALKKETIDETGIEEVGSDMGAEELDEWMMGDIEFADDPEEIRKRLAMTEAQPLYDNGVITVVGDDEKEKIFGDALGVTVSDRAVKKEKKKPKVIIEEA